MPAPVIGSTPSHTRLATPSPPAPAFRDHRIAFLILAVGVLGLAVSGAALNPLDWPVLAGGIILIFGVPHGAFDVAIWTRKSGRGGPYGTLAFLAKYTALATGFFGLWFLAPELALPIFIAMSIYHFAADWDRDLDILPRLTVAAAMIAAPAGLHRGEVIEIFSWLAPAPAASLVALVMAAAALPLLQASAVVIAVTAARHPWAAAELAAVLALAWLTPPLMFFLIYFCGLHSVRHVIETHQLLGMASNRAFALAAFPYAPLAMIAIAAGAATLSALPLGPALIGTIFMALAALTVPHMLVVDRHAP